MRGIQLTDYELDIRIATDRSDKIVSGIVIGDILHQNQAIILAMGKGELKANPAIGVGIGQMLLSEDLSAIKNEIRQQLELDGQNVKDIVITSQGIGINAAYKE